MELNEMESHANPKKVSTNKVCVLNGAKSSHTEGILRGWVWTGCVEVNNNLFKTICDNNAKNSTNLKWNNQW